MEKIGEMISGLFVFGIWIAAVVGWFMNCYQLYAYVYHNGEFALKVIGVVVFPLGAIMGWV